VPEGLLLDAASGVVDGSVRQPHGVEVIDHQSGVVEVIGECFAVSGGGVQGGEPDPVTPVLSSFRKPVAQHVSGSACDDVEEPVTVQVDDLGGVDGVVIGRGVEEPFLVDPDRGHAF
jgi:hypothetical protein